MSPKDYLSMPYSRVITPDGDAWLGEIREFPGCISTGFTAVEALTNLEGVAESWLEATLERGKDIPKPDDR